MSQSRPAAPLSFNPEFAEPVAASPLLFDRLRVPCQCGGALVGEEYEFFPSTVFIRGVCPACGPQTAVFAPPLHESGADKHARTTEALSRLNAQEEAALIDFLAYVRERETVPDEPGTRPATSQP